VIVKVDSTTIAGWWRETSRKKEVGAFSPSISTEVIFTKFGTAGVLPWQLSMLCVRFFGGHISDVLKWKPHHPRISVYVAVQHVKGVLLEHFVTRKLIVNLQSLRVLPK
jgi:hypothetical protein